MSEALDINATFQVSDITPPNPAEEHKQKFFDRVKDLPHRGQGLNDSLVGVCNTGINAGLSPDEIAAAITLERGNELKRGEVERAVNKAADGKGYVSAPVRKPRTEGEKARDIIAADETKKEKLNQEKIEAGGGTIEMDAPELWESSFPRPVGYENPARMQGGEALTDILYFLKTFYADDELLYIGNGKEKQSEQAEHVKTVSDWYTFFRDAIHAARDEAAVKRLGERYFYMIANPLTGKKNKDGSLRGDECIAAFRFVLIESDNLPLNQQIPLFRGLHLPIYALTYSGSKSIHALVNAAKLTGAKIETLTQWKNEVKEKFFRGDFKNIKIDPATNNAARLSRTPGMFRTDKGRFQRTIYLNAKGEDIWQTTNKYL